MSQSRNPETGDIFIAICNHLRELEKPINLNYQTNEAIHSTGDKVKHAPNLAMLLNTLHDLICVKNTCPDSYIINIAINKLGLWQCVEDAYALYEIAHDKKLTNDITHNCMIDVFVKNQASTNNYLACAKQLFEQHLAGYFNNNVENTPTPRIDLHGYSQGAAYILLRELLLKRNTDLALVVITGRGKHTKKVGHLPPIKQAVYSFCQENSDTCELVELDNPGALIVRYSAPKLNISAKAFVSNPARFNELYRQATAAAAKKTGLKLSQ